MELKTKTIEQELINQYVLFQNEREDDLRFMVKKFLTIEELGEIINNCLAQTDPLKRKIVYYSALVEFATNVDMEQFVNQEGKIDADAIYNMLAENELFEFDNEITNVYHVWDVIYEVESPYNIIKGAVAELVKGGNTKELLATLAEAQQNLKEQEAIHADIFNNENLEQQTDVQMPLK